MENFSDTCRNPLGNFNVDDVETCILSAGMVVALAMAEWKSELTDPFHAISTVAWPAKVSTGIVVARGVGTSHAGDGAREDFVGAMVGDGVGETVGT
jgi:hypothetical protein